MSIFSTAVDATATIDIDPSKVAAVFVDFSTLEHVNDTVDETNRNSNNDIDTNRNVEQIGYRRFIERFSNNNKRMNSFFS